LPFCAALHGYDAKPCGTAEPTLRSDVKMYTLIITAAIVVGLAFWVAAARLLRKLYRVSRKEARWLRLKDEGSNDNEPVITLNSSSS
jgi:hypothetical protein